MPSARSARAGIPRWRGPTSTSASGSRPTRRDTSIRSDSCPRACRRHRRPIRRRRRRLQPRFPLPATSPLPRRRPSTRRLRAPLRRLYPPGPPRRPRRPLPSCLPLRPQLRPHLRRRRPRRVARRRCLGRIGRLRSPAGRPSTAVRLSAARRPAPRPCRVGRRRLVRRSLPRRCAPARLRVPRTRSVRPWQRENGLLPRLAPPRSRGSHARRARRCRTQPFRWRPMHDAPRPSRRTCARAGRAQQHQACLGLPAGSCPARSPSSHCSCSARLPLSCSQRARKAGADPLV